MSMFSRMLAFSLITTTAVFAASKHSASITISESVHAGTNTIPPGNYNLRWDADSGDTDLSMTAGSQHFTLPISVKAEPSLVNDSVMTGNEGNETVLHGFRVKKTVLTVR